MRPSSVWIAATMACLAVAPAATADRVDAVMSVHAVVRPHVRLEPVAAPATLTIGADDVARGYVEAVRRFTLRSNAPDRVLLQFQPQAGCAAAIDLSGLGAPLRVPAAGLEVLAPPARDLEISFRLWLHPGTTPGAYPLPLRVAAAIL